MIVTFSSLRRVNYLQVATITFSHNNAHDEIFLLELYDDAQWKSVIYLTIYLCVLIPTSIKIKSSSLSSFSFPLS